MSFAGRTTLARSVLLSITSYFMQSMMITRKVSNEIKSLVKCFIWDSFDNKRIISLVGWDFICQSKGYSGLGLRKLRDQNISFLMKLGFKIVSDREALWVQVLRSKY